MEEFGRGPRVVKKKPPVPIRQPPIGGILPLASLGHSRSNDAMSGISGDQLLRHHSEPSIVPLASDTTSAPQPTSPLQPRKKPKPDLAPKPLLAKPDDAAAHSAPEDSAEVVAGSRFSHSRSISAGHLNFSNNGAPPMPIVGKKLKPSLPPKPATSSRDQSDASPVFGAASDAQQMEEPSSNLPEASNTTGSEIGGYRRLLSDLTSTREDAQNLQRLNEEYRSLDDEMIVVESKVVAAPSVKAVKVKPIPTARKRVGSRSKRKSETKLVSARNSSAQSAKDTSAVEAPFDPLMDVLAAYAGSDTPDIIASAEDTALEQCVEDDEEDEESEYDYSTEEDGSCEEETVDTEHPPTPPQTTGAAIQVVDLPSLNRIEPSFGSMPPCDLELLDDEDLEKVVDAAVARVESSKPVIIESGGPVVIDSVEPVVVDSVKPVIIDSVEPVAVDSVDPAVIDLVEPVTVPESGEGKVRFASTVLVGLDGVAPLSRNDSHSDNDSDSDIVIDMSEGVVDVSKYFSMPRPVSSSLPLRNQKTIDCDSDGDGDEAVVKVMELVRSAEEMHPSEPSAATQEAQRMYDQHHVMMEKVYDVQDPQVARGLEKLVERGADIVGDDDLDDDEDAELDPAIVTVEDDPIYEESVDLAKKNQLKRLNISKEILSTERTYVSSLHMLNDLFYARIRAANEKKELLPKDAVSLIFSNVQQLVSLNDQFLEKLEHRMANWDSNPRVGDVFKSMAPFLKMYTTYIENFEVASALVNQYLKKSSAFAALIKECESDPRCRGLGMQDSLLEPVQRIPRYKLLLADYLKYTPEDHIDYHDTQNALEIVSTVAKHVNESIRMKQNFRKMVNIQSSFVKTKYSSLNQVIAELVAPNRKLILQGTLEKMCRKGLKSRELFLFNDCLIYATEQTSATNVVQYQLHCVIPLRNFHVKAVKMGLHVDNEMFCMQMMSQAKTFLMYTKTKQERQEWIDAIRQAVNDLPPLHDRKSFAEPAHAASQDTAPPVDPASLSEEQGEVVRAPLWVPDSGTSMCMSCASEFSLLRRRHHCRCCGKVFCAPCSNHKITYKGRTVRCCAECEKKYGGKEARFSSMNMSVPDEDEEEIEDESDLYAADPTLQIELDAGSRRTLKPKPRPKSLMKVKPSLLEPASGIIREQNCEMCGYLTKQGGRVKTWRRRWFVLRNLCLYYYKAPEDVRALGMITLPSYQVGKVTKADGMDKEFCFKVSHPNSRTYFFQADNQEQMDRWLHALEFAVKAEQVSFLDQDGEWRPKQTETTGSAGSYDEDFSEMSEASQSASITSIVFDKPPAMVMPATASKPSATSPRMEPIAETPQVSNVPPTRVGSRPLSSSTALATPTLSSASSKNFLASAEAPNTNKNGATAAQQILQSVVASSTPAVRTGKVTGKPPPPPPRHAVKRSDITPTSPVPAPVPAPVPMPTAPAQTAQTVQQLPGTVPIPIIPAGPAPAPPPRKVRRSPAGPVSPPKE